MLRLSPRAVGLAVWYAVVVCIGLSNTITHGPMLGHVTAESIRVWARTANVGAFVVEYVEADDAGAADWSRATVSDPVFTVFPNDNTGWVTLAGLNPGTMYHYRVWAYNGQLGEGGTFRTLPAARDAVDPEHNPRGLFNYRFEFGDSVARYSSHGTGPNLPIPEPRVGEAKDQALFAVKSGNRFHPESRDYPVSQWVEDLKIPDGDIPTHVAFAPEIVGVWASYKNVMSTAEDLAVRHRNVPSYFTVNQPEWFIERSALGTPGLRERRAVWRDLGTFAWYDYRGWANPVEFTQEVSFGHAQLEAGSGLLIDSKANFTQIDWAQSANLQVDSGRALADAAAAVYEVVEVIDDLTLRILPEAAVTAEVSYSIGRRSYSTFTVGNSDYFLLDAKTHQENAENDETGTSGGSFLGPEQREWLQSEMAASEADFFFVFWSEPFVEFHRGGGEKSKASDDIDSWARFGDEREQLIQFWKELGKPVFLMKSDGRESYSIKIADQIWAFCTGSPGSVNQGFSASMDFTEGEPGVFGKRGVDRRWSSVRFDGTSGSDSVASHYCVVQIKNVINAPTELGEALWVAVEYPEVVFQFFDGQSGELHYVETVSARR